jgi:hypothetical protein
MVMNGVIGRWSLVLLFAGPACGENPLSRWVTRTRQVDSLCVEGRFLQYRVPADRDADNPANWVVRADVCPTAEFRLLLRRPDFKIEVRTLDPHTNAMRDGSQHDVYSWVDGKLSTWCCQERPSEERSGSIAARSRSPLLSVQPYLTPVEYHFFDWPTDDVPLEFANRPHRIEGNAVTIEIHMDKKTPGNRWGGWIEVDPEHGYCPMRMNLTIGGELQDQVSWDMKTLETQMVNGVPIISKARFILFNPAVNQAERVVYLYEAFKIEQRPITRGDLELVFPPGTPVMDFSTMRSWVVGDPESVRDVDPELVRQVGRAIVAQQLTPEIRSQRQSAMQWILISAGAVTLLLAALGYRIRQLRAAR